MKNKVIAAAVAVMLGLEVIAPGAEQHPHVEKEVIEAPEAAGSEADALRPFTTPPENPWLSDFALRVISPEELKDWWVNTTTTRSGGLVTVMRTQTCGEARFKEIAVLHNPNTNQEVKAAVYLNEDYVISWRTRKMCEQLQQWLLQRASPRRFYFACTATTAVLQTTAHSPPATHQFMTTAMAFNPQRNNSNLCDQN